MPRRPRPPCAEHQHRDDRRPLIQFGKLGGFHFNDSKYGDDDLDAGSIDPYRLFLVFNELVEAEQRGVNDFNPAHMIDQSHNVTDPIESLINSANEIRRAYAQALIVDRKALSGYPGRQRRADGNGNAEARLPRRCRADPRRSPSPRRPAAPIAPSIRSRRHLSRQRLPQEGVSRRPDEQAVLLRPPNTRFRE
jgi:L-rhamnose isomerase/sugar isomerase